MDVVYFGEQAKKQTQAKEDVKTVKKDLEKEKSTLKTLKAKQEEVANSAAASKEEKEKATKAVTAQVNLSACVIKFFRFFFGVGIVRSQQCAPAILLRETQA